jgi:hypothetical protein
MKERFLVALAATLTALAWSTTAVATHAPPGTKFWGYEASFADSRILQYDIGTDTFDTSCVPQGVPAASNGRGIAFDPRLAGGAGGFHITRLTEFVGDGFIHQVGLPPTCPNLGRIPFGDGPGGVDPDDIGALDLDPDTGNLYAAEYIPKDVSTLFEVDASSGAIIRACNLPPLDGNDTLAVVNNYPGLPPGKHLVTDNGEFSTTAQFVIPVTSMGAWMGPAMAPPCTIAATGMTPGGRTGYDFEDPPANDLIATDLENIYDHNGFPWTTTQATMSAAPSFTLEDTTLRTTVGEVCPPEDDDDNGDDDNGNGRGDDDDDDDDDGLTNKNESLFLTLLGNSDSDLDGIKDGNDDANGNGEDDEDEDDDECPDDDDSDGDGEDDEDEDDDEDDD